MRPALSKLLKDLERFGEEHGGMWNIPPQTGQFLYLLVKLTRARRILEVGTSNGYSTLWLAEAIRQTKGEKIVTIERDPFKLNLARENFRRASLSQWIELCYGEALGLLNHIKGPFDFVFIDAEKEEYLRYLRKILPKTKPGTVILADNAIQFSHRMKDYLNFVRKHPGLESVLIPIGSGEEMTLRKK